MSDEMVKVGVQGIRGLTLRLSLEVGDEQDWEERAVEVERPTTTKAGDGSNPHRHPLEDLHRNLVGIFLERLKAEHVLSVIVLIWL